MWAVLNVQCPLFYHLKPKSNFDINTINSAKLNVYFTACKMPIFGVFLVHIFTHSDWIMKDIRRYSEIVTDTFLTVFYITFKRHSIFLTFLPWLQEPFILTILNVSLMLVNKHNQFHRTPNRNREKSVLHTRTYVFWKWSKSNCNYRQKRRFIENYLCHSFY